MIIFGYPIEMLSLYGYLSLVLVVSTVTDIRCRRIPNWATFSTILLALVIHCIHNGLPGLLLSLKGLGLGFALLLLPHLLGGIGAGDVKLLAAVGAVLGPDQTFLVFLFTAIIGGIVALVTMAYRKEFWSTLRNIGTMLYGFCSGAGVAAFQVDRASLKEKGIPYGAVIAAGVLAAVLYSSFMSNGLPGRLG